MMFTSCHVLKDILKIISLKKSKTNGRYSVNDWTDFFSDQ